MSGVMFRVEGKPFRCPCGGNVFHADPVVEDWWVCNACGATYEGSR